MHNTPVERHQADGKNDEYSDITGIIFTGPGRTRQEHKYDSDINYLLERMKAGDDPRKQLPRWGDQDFQLDLQSAIHSVAEAEAMMARLPQALKQKYETWQELMAAATNGTLKKDLDNTEAKEALLKAERRRQIERDEEIAAERSREARRKAAELRDFHPDPRSAETSSKTDT